MARPRKPTNLLLFTDAAKKHPERMRERANEPKPSGPLGEPPSYFTQDEVEAWVQIVSSAAPGQLTCADFIGVEICARLYARVRNGDDHPKILSELRLYMGQLGLTPASRPKVSAVPTSKPSSGLISQIIGN